MIQFSPLLLPSRALSVRGCWPVRTLLIALMVALSACQSTPMPGGPAPQRPIPSAVDETANLSADALMQQAAGATGNRATALYLSAAEAYMKDADWSGVRAAVAGAQNAHQRADLFLRYANLNAALALSEGDAEKAQQWLRSREPALAELGGRDPVLAQTAVIQAVTCERQQRWACAANSLMRLEEPDAFLQAPWFPANNAAIHAQVPSAASKPTRVPFERLHQQPAIGMAASDDGGIPEHRGGAPAVVEPVPGRSIAPEQAGALRLNEQIWHYVCMTPASVAGEQILAGDRKQQGWWELRSATAQGGSLGAQRGAIKQWQQGNRAHAAQFPWPGAIAAVLEQRAAIRNVAILLPLSGPLSAAGSAVRNGFIAAALTDQMRLNARFYDTAAEPLPSLYERAISEGAEVLIGPLSKANVEILQSVNPELPMLALNYLSEGAPTARNVLQLGLAIEDEADTLARRLQQQNLERILILHSEQDWSRRAATKLQAQIGAGATIESFADAKTVTEAVGRGMFVEESHLRSQQIYQRIGTHIEFTPRARQDLDAVVALVNNTEAKVLVPALKFHFGDYLPVYATGQAARGAEAEDLKSLSGFQITELPWFINGGALAGEVTQAFRLTGNSLAALYALGSDAYQIADRLPLLAQHRDLIFNGNSGALNVSPDGRFHRELAWGTIAQQRVVATPRVSAR